MDLSGKQKTTRYTTDGLSSSLIYPPGSPAIHFQDPWLCVIKFPWFCPCRSINT